MVLKAPLRVMEIDLAAPLEPLDWQPAENGAHVLVRHGMDLVGRLWLERSAHPGGLTAEALETLARQKLGMELTRRLLYRELIAGLDLGPPPPPSLTITVCTRNRPAMLRRCIESIRATCARHPELATNVEVLVVDNAPPDDATRDVVAEFPDVRHVREPVPGLDFARNCAMHESSRDYIAYIDDDAIADRHWLRALAEAVWHYPKAACITGAVLPAFLATSAQMEFERTGGFLKGFELQRYAKERWDDGQHPCNAGKAGTGANMIVKTKVIRELGGFDEALDTGAPLPGGGDLDLFYRVNRNGHLVLYEPQMAVTHEHRRDQRALREQYFAYGLAKMAFIRKHMERDPEMRHRLWSIIRSYVIRRPVLEILKKIYRPGTGRRLGQIGAEIVGFVQGYFGEYERSEARIGQLRRDHSA